MNFVKNYIVSAKVRTFCEDAELEAFIASRRLIKTGRAQPHETQTKIAGLNADSETDFEAAYQRKLPYHSIVIYHELWPNTNRTLKRTSNWPKIGASPLP